MSSTLQYVHVYIKLDFVYIEMLNCFVNQNVHVYIKHGSFRFKSNENTYPKGRALM